MKEILDAYPDGNAVLALPEGELDSFILECVRRRAAGNGLTLPKFLSRGELENVYGVNLALPAPRVLAINEKLAAAYHRLLSSNRLMPATGQPPDVVTIGSAPPDHLSGGKTLLEWAGSRRLTLAIVFSDIVDSTALGVELGDAAMGDIRRRHFDCAAQLIAKNEGKLVKTIGDGVMAVFRMVDAGLEPSPAIKRRALGGLGTDGLIPLGNRRGAGQ